MATATPVPVEPECCVCFESTGTGNVKLVEVTDKGKKTLLNAAKVKNEYKVLRHFENNNNTKVYVHESCRKSFTQKRNLHAAEVESKRQKIEFRRSTCPTFDFKTQCLLCVKSIHSKSKQWHRATTLTVKDTFMKHCKERLSINPFDSWALEVQGRTNSCVDFVAAEARYHRDCRARFADGQEKEFVGKRSGRPQNYELKRAFEKTCQWLEDDVELHTIKEFSQKLSTFTEVQVCSKYVQKLLTNKYAEHIFVAKLHGGKENVIIFKNTAKLLLNKEMKNQLQSFDEQKEKYVKVVGKIILSEIRDIVAKDTFPTPQELSDLNILDNWIPKSLNSLLEIFIKSPVKKVALAHSLVQSCRREINSPLLFGLGVELDHAFGSRWLNDHLSRLGFSISSDEIRRYKQSILSQTSEPLECANIPEGSFIQWSADNVDHNIITLDGKNTFHGMGIVGCVTPAVTTAQTRIPRNESRLLVKETTKDKGIKIIAYKRSGSQKTLDKLRFAEYNILRKPFQNHFDQHGHSYFKTSLDALWLSGYFFGNSGNRYVSWSGFMQNAYSLNQEYSTSTIFMLPIIDLQSSDPDCIYSTLLYIQHQSMKLKAIPCVTFDQPLWYKAMLIIHDKEMNIICRLGGFHMLMSFLGSIGKVMSGSGIEELLEEIFAKNVVPHILSGKAYSRAVRGHFLVQFALFQVLLQGMDTVEALKDIDPSEISDTFNNILNNPSCELSNECVQKLIAVGHAVKLHMETLQTSRTAKYWLRYMDYVQLVRDFIRAERTGDWNLHLHTTSEMLNLYAATGHIHYTKCSRMYLQHMYDLKQSHPTMYESFTQKGFHAIRRSNTYWSGLWSDFIIETFMMKSIKSRGGLTRGRGFTDNVRHQWVYTSHYCASIHEAMSSLTNLSLASSEQHVELGSARRKRDQADVQKIMDWLQLHSPFQNGDARLKSLHNDIVCDPRSGINCDRAEEVGMAIHQTLDLKAISEAKVKRKQQVTTISAVNNSVKTGKKKLNLNPNIMFYRLSALAGRDNDITRYFSYELTPYPLSIFKDGYMRKADKPALRNLLLKDSAETEVDARTTHNVLDGGALLHRCRWQLNSNTDGLGCTYLDVCKQYVSSIRWYGKATVVFDGYPQNSTKDHEHQRRGSVYAPEVDFNECTAVSTNQNVFLNNSKNKTKLIEMLTFELIAAGYKVMQCHGDADTLIVKQAMEISIEEPVNVVSDDTDVAVMLLHHLTDDLHSIYFTSNISKKTWSIQNAAKVLPKELDGILLSLHAFSGCDSTSAIFNKGKHTCYKMFKASTELQRFGKAFCSTKETDANDIKMIGTEVFKIMYGGKQCDSLAMLRYTKFQSMAASGELDPQKLPPTEDAAQLHSLRVYLQVQEWKQLIVQPLDPISWGWKLENGNLCPVHLKSDVAPENLIKFIRCNCKSGCARNSCSCRKNGLACVAACKNCCGLCENSDHDILTMEE